MSAASASAHRTGTSRETSITLTSHKKIGTRNLLLAPELEMHTVGPVEGGRCLRADSVNSLERNFSIYVDDLC